MERIFENLQNVLNLLNLNHTFEWISPYFQKYTKKTYAGKLLSNSNISRFIVCSNAHLFSIV